jgi:hypothetical protein
MAARIPSAPSTREVAFGFALWAGGLHRMPSVAEVRRYLRVSRPTAYRWHADWLTANGLKPLPRSAATERTTAAPEQRTSP